MRLIVALTDPDSIRTYLTGVGLPAKPPFIALARYHAGTGTPVPDT